MIRIHKTVEDTPAVLLDKGKAARQKLEEQYDVGSRNFEFDSSIYSHTQVKEKLIRIQSHKCCFCEAKIGHISYGDVEHFRPKAAWVQQDEPLNRPGYYWLAYDWSNLLLSCQLCNQRYKKNLFPLLNQTERATSHYQSIGNEQPLFINPAEEDPEQFIGYRDEIPFAIGDNEKGEITITQTGLRREELNNHRLEKLNPIRDLYNTAMGCPETDPDYKASVKALVLKYYEKCQSNTCEYASMLRCFFKAHPVTAL